MGQNNSAFYNANYVFRLFIKILVLLWVATLITFATYMVFTHLDLIGGAVATIYSVLVSIFTTAILFLIRNEDRINKN